MDACITSLLGREIASKGKRRQMELLEAAFVYWRSKGFPYPTLSAAERNREFERLRAKSPTEIIRGNQARVITTGLKICNAFQPKIWKVVKGGRSPFDCFYDDKILKACLAKCVRFYPNRRCWNAQCLRSVLKLHHKSAVSNFRPTTAYAIYRKHAGASGRVLDFSSGYGGRLLGALAADVNYFGIEPEAAQVRGLLKMERSLRHASHSRVTVERGCAEDILPDLDSSSFDLALSSPPYFDTEKYSNSKQQSYKRYPLYDEWLRGFMVPVIENTLRVLRPGGLLFLNVANSKRISLADDVFKIASSKARHLETIRLNLHSLPHQMKAGAKLRFEPIFVFESKGSPSYAQLNVSRKRS